MRVSAVCCGLGVFFVLAIAVLHGSGFGEFTGQMRASDAAPFLKDMFSVLYAMPTLYLVVLGVFGCLALMKPTMRSPICWVLGPAVLAAGALALLLGEWIPLLVMGAGGALFVVAAITAKSSDA